MSQYPIILSRAIEVHYYSSILVGYGRLPRCSAADNHLLSGYRMRFAFSYGFAPSTGRPIPSHIIQYLDNTIDTSQVDNPTSNVRVQ